MLGHAQRHRSLAGAGIAGERHVQRRRRPDARSMRLRMRSISSSEAISLIRVLTGFSPINSRSSSDPAPRRCRTSSNSRRKIDLRRGRRVADAASTTDQRAHDPAVALASRSIGRIGSRRIADVAASHLMPLEPEARLFLRPVDDEGEPHRLPAMAGVERRQADVAVAIHLAAFGQLHHHAGGVAESRTSAGPTCPR